MSTEFFELHFIQMNSYSVCVVTGLGGGGGGNKGESDPDGSMFSYVRFERRQSVPEADIVTMSGCRTVTLGVMRGDWHRGKRRLSSRYHRQ